MASAETFRQFATARFVQEVNESAPKEEDLQLWNVYRLFPDEITGGVLDSAMRSVGALVEREGWHTLGAHLAVLNDPKPIDEDDRAIIQRVLESPNIGVWPGWFRRFATLLLARHSAEDLWGDLPIVEPEMVAVFQAALVVAGGLRDPYISRLQLFLQSSVSPLDNRSGKVDAEMVFAQFEDNLNENLAGRGAIQPLPQSVAGLFKLIEIMASFDSLFADVEERRYRDMAERLKGGFEVYPGSSGRFAIARATANLVTWRFNLRDQRTVNRLAVVLDAFWDICEVQLHRHLDAGVRWSSTGSNDALIAMLERWRDRADPEPDAQPETDYLGIILERTERQTLKEEAELEGSEGL